MDLRTALAAVLGVGLGLLLIAYPGAVVRAHTAGRLPHDRGGEYGSESEPSRRVLLLVRALGLVAILIGLYLGWTGLV